MKFKFFTKEDKTNNPYEDIRNQASELQGLIAQYRDISILLEGYKENNYISVEYNMPGSNVNYLRIRADDKMIEYLKERQAEIEKKIRSKVLE